MFFIERSASDELLSGVEPLPQPGTAAGDETSLKPSPQRPAQYLACTTVAARCGETTKPTEIQRLGATP